MATEAGGAVRLWRRAWRAGSAWVAVVVALAVSTGGVARGTSASFIPGPQKPITAMVLSPDGSRLYTAAPESPTSPIFTTLSEIDARSGALLRTIDLMQGVRRIVLSPDGATAYLDVGGEVLLFDLVTWTQGIEINIGTISTGMAVSADGSKLYVAGIQSGNAASLTVQSLVAPYSQRTIILPPNTDSDAGVAVTSDGTRAFVTGGHADTVLAVDLSAATPSISTWPGVASDPRALALSPDDKTLYVTAAGASEVYALNADNGDPSDYGSVVPGWPVAGIPNPGPVAVSPDGSTLWAGDSGSGTVYAVDTSTAVVTDTITDVDSTPTALAVSPDAQTLFVGGSGGTLTAIDTGLPERAVLRATGTVQPSLSEAGPTSTVIVTTDLSGSAATPSGNVVFATGRRKLCTAAVDLAGSASCSLRTGAAADQLPAGTDSVTAYYTGDSSYVPTFLSPATIVVMPAPTSVTIATVPAHPVAGQNLLVRATVTSDDGLPPGNVVLRGNGTTLCPTSEQPVAIGIFECSMVAPKTATFAIEADFAPEGGSAEPYLSSTSTVTLGLVPNPGSLNHHLIVGTTNWTSPFVYAPDADGDSLPAVSVNDVSGSIDALAIDPQGNVWFSNGGGAIFHEVSRAQLATSGSDVTRTLNASMRTASSIAFDNSGDLWFAVPAKGLIGEYTAHTIAASAPAPPDLILEDGGAATLQHPEALAFDRNGNLWFADGGSHAVSEFPASELTVDQANCVPNPDYLNSTAELCSRNPSVTVDLGGSVGPSAQPAGIAFDSTGNLWEVDASDGLLRRFGGADLVNGSPAAQATMTVTSAGSPATLTALAFDGAGGLWLAATDAALHLSPAVLAGTGILTPAPDRAIRGPHAMTNGATSLVVQDSVTPSAPRSPTAVAQYKQVRLAWTAPVSSGDAAISGYTILRSTDGSAFSQVGTASGLTWTATGLTPGRKYWFEVVADNVAGSSAPSTETVAIPYTTPSAPRSLVATAGKRQVALRWTAPATNGGVPVTGYKIYSSTNGSTFTPIKTVTTLSTTLTGLTGNRKYWFEVVAVNAAGPSPTTAKIAATPYTTPSAPRSFTATAGSRRIVLRWAAPVTNGGSRITDYRVYSSTNGRTWAALRTLTSTSTTITGLVRGRVYWVKVVALNAAGASPASTVRTARPT